MGVTIDQTNLGRSSLELPRRVEAVHARVEQEDRVVVGVGEVGLAPEPGLLVRADDGVARGLPARDHAVEIAFAVETDHCGAALLGVIGVQRQGRVAGQHEAGVRVGVVVAPAHDELEAQALVEGNGAVHVGDRHHDVIQEHGKMPPMEFETILYAVDGPVATITMNRPDAANAQNSKMLYEIDAALDAADANDDVRVVVLAGAGKHFSAGHDLKEILSGADEWARLRDTPEGKLRHEQVMYWEKCLRVRDFRKPTIAAVHGAVAAAGMMLACMCDLIVAADDTMFSNPVARMTGVGVEILVEPWELGPRKAKEFLWCAQKLDAETAERFGLVNRVVPRDELDAAVRELAENIALVPPVTAEAIKDVINHMVDGQGQRESWQYHFMVHQFVSNTATALKATEARKQGCMEEVKQEQAGAKGS